MDDLTITLIKRLADALEKIESLKNKLKRSEPAPIYTMGSPDPVSKDYWGWSGIDMKVMADGKPLPFVQAISYARSQYSKTELAGTLIFLSSPESAAFLKAWRQKPIHGLSLTLTNEVGDKVQYMFENVRVVEEGYGITIDDLVSEVQVTYVADNMIVPYVKKQGVRIDE